MAKIKNNKDKILLFSMLIFIIIDWRYLPIISNYLYLGITSCACILFISLFFKDDSKISRLLRFIACLLPLTFVTVDIFIGHHENNINNNNSLTKQLNDNKHQLTTIQNSSKSTYIQLNQEKDLSKKYDLQMKFNQEQSNINSKQKEIKKIKDELNE